MLVWMLLTGLQLYVHGLASGLSSIGSWWPSMLHLFTDWTLNVTGGTNMDVRLSHHYTMYSIIVWIMFHVYYQVWRTIFWNEADISIVVGGSKFVKEN
jgi:Ni/Fe-hydrogenase 1 B-type cytochrome subunit